MSYYCLSTLFLIGQTSESQKAIQDIIRNRDQYWDVRFAYPNHIEIRYSPTSPYDSNEYLKKYPTIVFEEIFWSESDYERLLVSYDIDDIHICDNIITYDEDEINYTNDEDEIKKAKELWDSIKQIKNEDPLKYLTPPSKEEILNATKGLTPNKLLMQSIKYNFVEGVMKSLQQNTNLKEAAMFFSIKNSWNDIKEFLLNNKLVDKELEQQYEEHLYERTKIIWKDINEELWDNLQDEGK